MICNLRVQGIPGRRDSTSDRDRTSTHILWQDAINRIRQVAHGLNDEGFIWVRVGAGHMDAP
jgi:hypothetical protein